MQKQIYLLRIYFKDKRFTCYLEISYKELVELSLKVNILEVFFKRILHHQRKNPAY